jgi:hypothetical protein
MATSSESKARTQTPAVKPTLATGGVNTNKEKATTGKPAPRLATGSNKNGVIEEKK